MYYVILAMYTVRLLGPTSNLKVAEDQKGGSYVAWLFI
jgi:hypothetical protein